MTKDEDIEAQSASVIPKSGRGSDLNVEKDPLIWEISGLTNHCDPEVGKKSKEILGKWNVMGNYCLVY